MPILDYLEIMSFCGYDMEAADRMVNEIVDQVQSEPDSEQSSE